MSRAPHDIGYISLIGNRTTNQDRCLSLKRSRSILLCVADGMGGHPKGEQAAQILIDVCKAYFGRSAGDVSDVNRFLTQLLCQAHQEILTFGTEHNPRIDPRTTAALALIVDQTAFWAHLGDSRLYHFRNGGLLKRTTDHSYVESLRRRGIISSEETGTHPKRNYVTHCLGGLLEAPKASYERVQLNQGDILMLCSDGLWGSINEALMRKILSSGVSMSNAAEHLANEAAQAAFPESDNVTIMAMRVGDLGPRTSVSKTHLAHEREDRVSRAILDLQAVIHDFEAEKNKVEP